MKTTQRVLAVLLALALGLALFAPAAMAEEQQASLFTQRLSTYTIVKTGQEVILKAQAKLPDNVDAELQYQWYASDRMRKEPHSPEEPELFPIEGATEPKLAVTITLEDFHFLELSWLFRVYCLRTYYILEDETIVFDNSYTTLFCNGSLNDLYQVIFHKNNLYTYAQGVEFFYKVILAPPILFVYACLAFVNGFYKIGALIFE